MLIEFSQLKVGDRAIVRECRLPNSYSVKSASQLKRLMMLGLTPGTTFSAVRVAPFGDPIEIKLRGFNLSLRREEAKGLWVEKQ